MIPYFKDTYGIDLWDEIGKLFIDCDGAYAFRYKYWNALHKFFIAFICNGKQKDSPNLTDNTTPTNWSA